MQRTPINSPELPVSVLPYSPAVRVGQWVFVSGQASVDQEGRIVRGSFTEEFNRSMENLRRVLAAAGATLADVVQVRAYVAEQQDLGEYNQLYRQWFPSDFPARTTLIGCLGDALSFEIDAVAFIPGESSA